MRITVRQKQPIVQPLIDHEHARELQVMNEALEKMPQAIELVHADLVRGLRDPDKPLRGSPPPQQVHQA